MRETTLWTSEPMKIGKHFWRIGVAVYTFPKLRLMDGKMKCLSPKKRHRCTFYEWRHEKSHVWNDAKMWPTYDHNRGEDGGMPKTLRKLYDRERETVRDLIDNAPEYRTELTPEGEQTVIPGCERNASPRATQLDLF